jgi:hypothetical protein
MSVMGQFLPRRLQAGVANSPSITAALARNRSGGDGPSDIPSSHKPTKMKAPVTIGAMSFERFAERSQ